MSCRQPGAESAECGVDMTPSAHARSGPAAAAAESSACGRRNTVGLTSILHRRHFPIFYIVTRWLSSRVVRSTARVQIAVATLSGNSLGQTVHTHCASVYQAAKLAAALLRVAGVTESNGSLLRLTAKNRDPLRNPIAQQFSMGYVYLFYILTVYSYLPLYCARV